MAEPHWNSGPQGPPPPPPAAGPTPGRTPPTVAPPPTLTPSAPPPAMQQAVSSTTSWVAVSLGAIGAGLVGALLALGISWWLPVGGNLGEQETAEAAPTSTQPVEEPEGAEGGGEAEEPTNVPEAEPEVPLSYADLADATLELPTQCVDWLFGDGASTTHTLVGGEVTGLPSESFLFELRETQPMDVGGKAFTVATFGCHVGSSPSMAPWAIYDADGNLVDEYDPESSEGVQGLTPAKYIENLRVQGQSFSYDYPGIMLADDVWCGTCQGSGSATVTWDFDGGEASLVEILYHLPTGDTTTPDPSDFGGMS